MFSRMSRVKFRFGLNNVQVISLAFLSSLIKTDKSELRSVEILGVHGLPAVSYRGSLGLTNEVTEHLVRLKAR